jgi:sec-independent protein translocase protein TatB
MFDLAWSEIALIAVVALVVIGPKDLPGAIRGIADGIKKARKGLAAMQQQADELVREAKLDDVRNQIAEVKGAINEIRRFDLKGEIEKHVDGDGTLKSTFNDPALNPSSYTSTTPAWTPPPTAKDTPDAPAFIPPQTMAPYKPPPEPPKPEGPAAPAFVPPSTPAPLNVAPPAYNAPEPAAPTTAPAAMAAPPIAPAPANTDPAPAPAPATRAS